MKKITVTMRFHGRLSGALGLNSWITDKRTIEVADNATNESIHDAARLALYYAQDKSPAYENVALIQITNIDS